MNGAHVHLVLTHFPIGGIVLVTALALLAALQRRDALMRIAFSGFVVVALSAVPLYLSGEEAEEQIESLSGVNEASIEAHEEAALPAFVGIEIVGVLALFALFLYRKSEIARTPLSQLILLLAIVACVLVGRSANLGGQIRHPEINDAARGEDS